VVESLLFVLCEGREGQKSLIFFSYLPDEGRDLKGISVSFRGFSLDVLKRFVQKILVFCTNQKRFSGKFGD